MEPPAGLTARELRELKVRVQRDGIESLGADEREQYEHARAYAKRMLAPFMPALNEGMRAYERTTVWERRRFPYLTPQRILALRRERSRGCIRRRAPRVTARRRSQSGSGRARNKSPGSKPREPDPVAARGRAA